MSTYPKSFIKTISGNGVERIALDAETEARLKADGWKLMGVEVHEPPPAEPKRGPK